jgi:hypothetical protein
MGNLISDSANPIPMNFLTRHSAWFRSLDDNEENTPPYPLCYDEWEAIQELERQREEVRVFESLRLQAKGDEWLVSGVSLPPAAAI